MHVGLYATKIAAEVMARGRAANLTYREFPDVTACWGMVDLVQSSNFRIQNGPEKGYLRGETFFDLINASIRPYAGITRFKEVGDAVVLVGDFRSLLESFILITQAAKQLAFIHGNQIYPFAVRCGIDFGIAKQLSRPELDFLGEPIDRLARIMSVRSQSSNILIGENAFEQNKTTVYEYRDLCQASDPIFLNSIGGKALTSQVIYRELYIVPGSESTFGDFFAQWSKNI